MQKNIWIEVNSFLLHCFQCLQPFQHRPRHPKVRKKYLLTNNLHAKDDDGGDDKHFDTIQMDRRLHQSVMFNILLINKEIPSLSYANKI